MNKWGKITHYLSENHSTKEESSQYYLLDNDGVYL